MKMLKEELRTILDDHAKGEMANLYGADLTYADLSGAKLTGAIFTDTIF